MHSLAFEFAHIRKVISTFVGGNIENIIEYIISDISILITSRRRKCKGAIEYKRGDIFVLCVGTDISSFLDLIIGSFAISFSLWGNAGQLADGSSKAIIELIEGDELMRLSLIMVAIVTGALAVVLALMGDVLSCPYFGRQYLLHDDVFDERERRFFESMLLHEILDLSLDVRHAGVMLQSDVLPCSILADINLHDE